MFQLSVLYLLLVAGENIESTEPILAQQLTYTVSNSESPPPERKRTISPPLTGYQTFIPIDDNFYDECERSSLLENEGGENGVENDLDVFRFAIEKKARPDPVSDDIEENMDGVIENEFDEVIDSTSEKSRAEIVIPGLVNENKPIYIEASKTEENGTNIKNMVADTMKNSEYVDEHEMDRFSSKHDIGKRTIFGNSPHIKIPEKKNGEWRAPEVFDKKSTKVPLKTLKPGTGSPALKAEGMDIDYKLKNKNEEQSKADIAIKGHSSLTGIIPFAAVKEPKTADVDENREGKTAERNDKIHTPNGITVHLTDQEYVDSAAAFNVDNNTRPQNSNKLNVVDKFEDRENAIINEIYDTDAVEHKNDLENLSDIDDNETEGMFNPSFGYGDGEFTSIFEAVEANYGYAGADQISIGSFQSNASSLQEQSESRVGSNHSSTKSSTTASPWHNNKQKEVQIGNLEAELKILTLESLNKSISETEENLLKTVGEEVRPNGIINRNFQDDINKTMSSGNSSGSGISSYVALGKIVKADSQAEIDKDGLGMAAEQSKEDESTENKSKVKEILILKEKESDRSKEERSAGDSDIELTHL